jgi:hypothetical protein
MMRWSPVLPAALVLTGCTGIFLPTEPDNTPEAVFDSFWSDFDEYYSYFREKGVDWDSVYATYRPRVTSTTGERELFTILTEMAAGFADGHVSLHSSFADWSYDGWLTRSPHNYYPEAVRRRLRGGGTPLGSGGMRAGLLDDQIGYLGIENFQDHGFDDAMDRAMKVLEGARALIVDVRFNGGGSDRNSDIVLGRFADRTRTYAWVEYRNGPRHDDFTAPRALTVQPDGRRRFTGPIAVLTNRGTFSTSEGFVLAMRTLPDVTVVGDTTGGGAGNPYWRELPNGWSFRLSRWRMTDIDGRSHEGVGILPDLPVWITDQDRADGVDTILEAAVTVLVDRLRVND